MTVGLIMFMFAIYAAQHGSYWVSAIGLLAMVVALIAVRMPRGF
jgi:hypothetical protein